MSKLTKALTAAAGNAGGGALYVEDVFSTYLYEGNASGQGANAQSITNNIDLSGEGGLTWIKNRDSGGSNAWSHYLFDTERGAAKYIRSNLTNAEAASNNSLSAFNSDGFTLGETGGTNNNGDSYVSWTFRKAEKFFDVLTYIGDGNATHEIAHNLGSVPGCIIIKNTSDATNWLVYHKDTVNDLMLNTTNGGLFQIINSVTSTSFNFSNSSLVNTSGSTYVAYLFASDAGGYGDDGDENIIKCGSYTGNGAVDGPTVTLGFEPQWIMIKGTGGGDWTIFDNMRGLAVGGNDARLWANQTSAENNGSPYIDLQPTGFKLQGSTGGAANGNGSDYIYIAIRRPMKTPEAGTEVFKATELTSPYGKTITTGWPVDMTLHAEVSSTGNRQIIDRLRGTSSSGPTNYLSTNATTAETALASYGYGYDNNEGYINNLWGGTDGIFYDFKRATGFMDVVAYSGNSVAGRAVAHNLGAVPELMLVKRRNQGGGQGWNVYAAPLGNTSFITLNTNQSAFTGQPVWNSTTPTSSVFYLNNDAEVNNSSYTYIAYLFATLAGVSKVGSYTGNAGYAVNVDCGFSAGARFILIKRSDSTGDWYVWDSARGIVSGNDPYLLVNSTAAEVTNTDYIDPLSSGFTVTSSAPAALNASGGTYIFLAIA